MSRWLIAQLGYNSSADATLSTNCRGNLKGLWEFIITSYKTADSKRHIQHVLAKHRREQEAARRAPEQEREAQERRQRLKQLQKRTAELEQTLASFQVGCHHHNVFLETASVVDADNISVIDCVTTVHMQARTEVQVQEATDQACEKSLLRHVLTSTQAQVKPRFEGTAQQTHGELTGVHALFPVCQACLLDTYDCAAAQQWQQHAVELRSQVFLKHHAEAAGVLLLCLCACAADSTAAGLCAPWPAPPA